ncbi:MULTISPECIES: outer membrane beta-barrel protein [Marinobacter]|uniref:Outer membrane beta-barrel protein n=1 Tax=Marinobacter suaedae TaxID=3057675 RepID=A0ABT8VZB2_9GAMM|nr:MULTISPECIES: outer membrane beta-barrel protein [unclassified Marinobacter]MBZ2169504.1 outer membrane beta-barrel protein [Marinobacter sp. F4216]MDO3721338.1 outer membrane beta-barrel protein [Marinobacter sp. chi1]
MKNPLPLALAVSLAAVSGTAFAGSDSGFYVGASVGQANLELNESDPDFGSIDFDDDDTGYKIFGGYNFGLIPLVDLAVEGAYVDFGSFGGSAGPVNADLDVTAWTGAGLAGIKLGPVGIFGKVGAALWDSEFSGGLGDDDGTDPLYGIGARFTLFSLQVRAEWERYDLDNADIDYFSVGGAFTF